LAGEGWIKRRKCKMKNNGEIVKFIKEKNYVMLKNIGMLSLNRKFIYVR